MTYEAEHHVRSVLVGDLRLPPEGRGGPGPGRPGRESPHAGRAQLALPGRLAEVRRAFYALWEQYAERAGGSWPAEPRRSVRSSRPSRRARTGCAQALSVRPVPRRRAGDGRPRPQLRPGQRASPGHLPDLAGLHLDAPDRPFGADREGRRGLALLRRPRARDRLGRHRQRDRRLSSALFSPRAGQGGPRGHAAAGPDQSAAPRFQLPGQPGHSGAGCSRLGLSDESGHGTHVAGIIAGCSPDGSVPLVADSKEAGDSGYVPRLASASCPAWRRPASW
jgi:hypothetical protein